MRTFSKPSMIKKCFVKLTPTNGLGVLHLDVERIRSVQTHEGGAFILYDTGPATVEFEVTETESEVMACLQEAVRTFNRYN